MCEHDKAQQEGARDTKGKAEGSLPDVSAFQFSRTTSYACQELPTVGPSLFESSARVGWREVELPYH